VIPTGDARVDKVSPVCVFGLTQETVETHSGEATAATRRKSEMHEHGICPSAEGPHCWTAHVVADHSEQGWMRLCNGVILFDDGFFIAPDGHSEPVVAA